MCLRNPCGVQILETKLQLYPLEETCYLTEMSLKQLEASQAPSIARLLAQAAIFS